MDGSKITTILGELYILINNKSVPYEITLLNNKSKYFRVDKRYKLTCNLPEHRENITVECKIQIDKTLNVLSGPNTGEDLALISFNWSDYMLSIGTTGDLPKVDYEYNDDSIIVSGDLKDNQIVFYVAWLKMSSEEEENYTWFAADPSYD